MAYNKHIMKAGLFEVAPKHIEAYLETSNDSRNNSLK